MEASALNHAATLPALGGRSPLLRLKSDEQLITLVRRGQTAAFEALVTRYQSRLLAFCRHMLGSTEDAEDVLQEVFAASFNAMLADDRPINARPWLYRIARNRCLNHLRRPQHAGQDSMDVFERDGGLTTADAVHKREEFRQIVADVQDLPETQKTALLLREIDALSYDQIAEAMETTVPSVKSLLVRARVSLAEAAEARLLTCDEVRMELGQVAEGLAKTTAPVRRHLKSCDRCRTFKGELRRANRALAAIYPLTPLIVVKKFAIGKLGALTGGTTAGGSGAAAGFGSTGGAVAGGAAAATGAGAGSALSAGLGALATKAAAGLAAVALVGAAGVEGNQVLHSTTHVSHAQAHVVASPAAPAKAQFAAVPAKIKSFTATTTPVVKAAAPTPTESSTAKAKKDDSKATDVKTADGTAVVDTSTPATPTPITPVTPATPADPTPVNPVQEDGSTVVLDQSGNGDPGSEWDQPGGSDSSSNGSTGSGSTTTGQTTGANGSSSSGTTNQQSQQPGASQSGPAGESSGSTGPQAQPAPVVAGEASARRIMHKMRRAVGRVAHP